MKFGEKLREARIKKGYTQQQLADMLGSSFNTISNYETGKTYPHSRDIYAKLADILDVDQNYLHNENDDFISDAAEKYGRTGKNQAEALIGAFGGLFSGGELSEEDKDAVMHAIQEIYWGCKIENKNKYSPKKFKTSDKDGGAD